MAHRSGTGPGYILRFTFWLKSAGRRHAALLIVLAIFLAVTLVYGLLNPLGEAPDEIAHVDLIRFIGKEGHLPRDAAEREAASYKSDSPMLYHALIGLATSWIDYDVLPRLKANDISPQHLVINDGLSPFALIHTEDEAFPYQGVVLAWHLARLISALLGAATLVIVYIIVLTIRPGDHWLALGASAVVAAIPRFHFTASTVGDDNLLGLLAALFTLTVLWIWRQPERFWSYALLGVWFGLALTTKYTLVVWLPLVAILLAIGVGRKRLSWPAAAWRLLIFSATAAAAAAWWFIYVERHFNEVRELGFVAGLIRPLGFDSSTQRLISLLANSPAHPAPPPGAPLPSATAISSPVGWAVSPPTAAATVWDWAIGLFRTFWFVPGDTHETLVTALTLVFLGLCGLAIAGLIAQKAFLEGGAAPLRRRGEGLNWWILGLLVLQIGLLLPVPLLRFYLTRNVAEAGQGRHILIPAAAAVGLLLVVGLAAWLPPDRRHFVGPSLAGVLLVISLVNFFGLRLPAFPTRLPVRTSAHATRHVPNPVNIAFLDGIELIGYETGQVNEYGALPITLIWHSQASVVRSYLVELTLVDGRGQIRGISLGHPVQGRYPTRAWEPGDVVRDTTWLPLSGLEAGNYQLQLRLQPLNNTDLSSYDDASSPEPGILLDSVDIPPLPSRQVARHLARLPAHRLATGSGGAVGFDVWQAGQPTSDMPVYGYRATIPVTLATSHAVGWADSPPVAVSPPRVSLAGPDDVQVTPIARANGTSLFLVDASWPSGEYRLQTQGDSERLESDPVLRVEVRPRSSEVPPMSNQVYADFGDEITLLGFDFPERSVQPGGALPITLYWQARRPMEHHYIVSNHLLNRVDLRQWGGQDRVPRDYYSTTLWTPGEVVRDEYLVPVAASAPDGVYRLDIGLYVEAAGQSWPLPLIQDGRVLDTNNVTIAPIKVGGPPPGVTVEKPSPQNPASVNLAGLVTFLGYDLSLGNEALDLILYWRADAPLPADYTTFVHIRDHTGQATGTPGTIVAQMDRPPADGAYPSSLWDAGEIIRDAIHIPIPPGAPRGEYEVVIGLYDLTTGQRLPVLDDQGQPSYDHTSCDNTSCDYTSCDYTSCDYILLEPITVP